MTVTVAAEEGGVVVLRIYESHRNRSRDPWEIARRVKTGIFARSLTLTKISLIFPANKLMFDIGKILKTYFNLNLK